MLSLAVTLAEGDLCEVYTRPITMAIQYRHSPFNSIRTADLMSNVSEVSSHVFDLRPW